MKTRTATLLAAAAAMAVSKEENKYPLRSWVDMSNLKFLPSVGSKNRQKGGLNQNQRQRRKDRRRAWAAGYKKAFSGKKVR